MTVFSHPEFFDHEQIVYVSDRASGLRALIGVHNTNLGPGLGGCRMWRYAREEEALTDVLRLSRGMTYKNAMANLPLGGGKTVIIGNAATDKTPAMFQALGRAIDRLNGAYVTAEDVGTSPADMLEIRKSTQFVVGLDPASGGRGDPSPATALGCFVGIRAAVRAQLGQSDLSGLTVAVQGLGHVGYDLARQLHDAGARLIVTDVNAVNVERAVQQLAAVAVAPEAIYDVQADIYAPCALGATVNDTTIDRFKVKIIAGCANNVLARPEHGDRLMEKGILYAPDYVINAGGVIKVGGEYINMPIAEVEQRVLGIEATLDGVFRKAALDGINPAKAADAIAEARIYGDANAAAA